MGDRLQGRAALVTGGGKGIGRATAEAFAREGARVAILDYRLDFAEEAAQAIEAAGGTAIALQGNVADRDAVFAAAAAAEAEWGPLTILLNNAMWNRYGPLEAQDEKMIARMIDVGLKGVIWGIQAAVPQMRAAGGGAVVNVASPSAVLAMRHGVMYSAVKAAVAAATRSCAAEFGPDAIRVNAVAPGPTRTDGADLVVSEEAWERRRKRMPIGRLGRPEDTAAAAVFLASDEASFITGGMLLVDGGVTYAFS